MTTNLTSALNELTARQRQRRPWRRLWIALLVFAWATGAVACCVPPHETAYNLFSYLAVTSLLAAAIVAIVTEGNRAT